MKMNLFIIIASLISEVIYYSIFLKNCRKERKLSRYILIGIIVTALALIFNTKDLLSYLVLVLTFTLGLKYIVKVKTSLFDMFIVIVMLFVKVSLELVAFVIFYMLFNNYTLYIVFMITFKILFLLVTKDKLKCFYNRLKELWLSNTFKIRYIFICSTYIYVIITALFKLYFK